MPYWVFNGNRRWCQTYDLRNAESIAESGSANGREFEVRLAGVIVSRWFNGKKVVG